MGDVQDSLTDLIESIREKGESPDGDDQEHWSNMVDFRSPCQLELFWVDEPIEFQIIIRTRDDNREDGTTIVNGPYSGEEFLEEAEDILDKPRWQQIAEDPFNRVREPKQYIKRKDVIIPLIVDAIESMQRGIFSENRIPFGVGGAFGENDWCYYIDWNIAERDIEKIVSEELPLYPHIDWDTEGQEEAPAESSEVSEEESPSGDKTVGMGTHIYEPVWVSEPPQRDLSTIVRDDVMANWNRAINSDFGDTEISVYQDGFILLKTDDINEATEIINTIFGVAMFFGYSWYSIQPNEVIEVDVGEKRRSYHGSPGLPRELLNTGPLSEFSTGDLNSFVEREIIEEDKLSDILEHSETIYENEEMKEKVNFLLQAYSHYLNQEYSQSFLLSWISIEQLVNQMLNEHLRDERDVNHDRRDRITDSPNWYASHKIELSEISGAIQPEVYEKIDELRSKRNEIVHEMRVATKEEAKEVTELAMRLAERKLPAGVDSGPTLE